MRIAMLIVFAICACYSFDAIKLVVEYHTSQSLNDVNPYTFSILHCVQLVLMPMLTVACFAWLVRYMR